MSYEHPPACAKVEALLLSVENKIYVLPEALVNCSLSFPTRFCRSLSFSSFFISFPALICHSFSATLFLDFTAFRWIHPARSFSTIASTPLRHLSLFAAVLRKMSRCLPFSRSSILKLKCIRLSCIVSLSLIRRSLCSRQ